MKNKEDADIRIAEIMPELFQGWLRMPFEDILTDKVGDYIKLKQSATNVSGKYSVVDQGEELINGYVDDEKLLYKGELPVIIFGDHTRRLKFIDFKFAVGADGTKILKPHAFLDIKFFYYYLRSLSIKSEGYSRHYKFLKSIEVPVPPYSEQKRIVAKLDELMKKIDRSRARLERIPTILKRFRQSILSAAVSGKLTEEWRERNNIIDEWEEKELKDVIIDKPKNGFSAKPVNHKTKFRVLTLTATTSGRFIPEHFKYFEEPIEKGSQFWLQPNDILVQRGNTLEYVGVPAIYDGQPNQFIYPDLMMRLRVNDLITTKYLYYFLSAESTRNYLRDRATGTSGNMPKINQPTLMSVPIALPKMNEQIEIVRRVEQFFLLADKIETRYNKAKAQLDQLPQSLLAKAFRGELVPHDENDEPASVLWERIKKEKAQKAKTRTNLKQLV
jgi:type I restriction enzyme S subunit